MQEKPFPGKITVYVWLPMLLALTLVLGMTIGMKLQESAPALANDKQLDAPGLGGQGKIEELIRYIEAKYVDEVDRDRLLDEAILSIIKQLDPHSSYIPAEQLREINEQLEGNFEGIGVEFMILDDTVTVVSALPGGPSEAAGIRPGDKIVMVGDSLIAGVNINSQKVMGLLRGDKGTKVSVSVKRSGEERLRRLQIVRDKIPMHSVEAAYMINKKTGYIKINRFSATTYEEFMRELERLVEKEGMKDLVIDVRHNPGGYLQQATNILSQLFSEKNKLLVYTEGRGVNRSNYESNGRAFFRIDGVAVLIDEGSASASEILAGAIQDHDRGVIIGRRSFGKGLVQEQYRLRDGSALRLTVARYFTPSGRSIQKPYTTREDYDNDFSERWQSGELLSEERAPIGDSIHYFTARGRVVYGGGGISPDVFVPMDTALLSEYYQELRQLAPAFIFRHMERRAPDYRGLMLDDFLSGKYQIPEALFAEFVQFAQKQGAALDTRREMAVKAELKRLLAARVAKHLFGDHGFYVVWNRDDPFVHKALEKLASASPISSK
jgi:carboxyl-terminal processing protease